MLSTREFSTLLRRAAQNEISLRGAEGSGAFNFYKVLADEDRMFGPNRAAFVDLIRAKIKPDQIVHEIGDGAGLITLALFDAGYDCVNLCANGQRSRFSESLAKDLKADMIRRNGTAGRYRILKDRFPSQLTLHLLQQEPKAAFVSFDSVNDQFSDNEANVLRRIGDYQDVFINLNQFLRKRNTPSEQAQVITKLEKHGLEVRHLDPVESKSRTVWMSKV